VEEDDNELQHFKRGKITQLALLCPEAAFELFQRQAFELFQRQSQFVLTQLNRRFSLITQN
jgi:hypothetical protein